MLTCKECGRMFLTLQSHVRNAHKMTTHEYRDKYGADVQFMSDATLEKKKKNGYSCWSVKDRMSRGETEEEAKQNIINLKKESFGAHTSVRNVLHWELRGYSAEEAKARVFEIQNRNSEFFVKKHGESGEEVYKKIRKNMGKSNTKEAMLARGLTEEDIRLLRDNFSVDSLMKKYGITYEDAVSLRESRMDTAFNPRNIDSWMAKGFTREEAKSKVKVTQSRGLKFFELKYGKDEGKQRYNEFVRKATSISVGKFASKESSVYFAPLIEWCNVQGHNIEFEKYVTVDSKTYYVDCVIQDLNIAIEYDGKAFHANPDVIDEDWVSARKALPYWDSIRLDKLKTERLESIGYRVIRVHSSKSAEIDIVKIVKDMKNGTV